MASYEAGSVTAKVILDTSKWNEAIADLKKEVGELETTFNSIKGDNGLDSQIKKLKEEISTLTKTNENYQKTIDELRKTNEKLSKGAKEVSKGLKSEQKTLETSIKKTNETVKSNEKLTKSLKDVETQAKKTKKSVEIPTNEIGYAKNGIQGRHSISGVESFRDEKYSKRYGQNQDVDRSGFKKASVGLKEVQAIIDFKKSLSELAAQLKKTNAEQNRFATTSDKVIASMTKQAARNEYYWAMKELAAAIKNTNTEQNRFAEGANKVIKAMTKQAEVNETQIINSFKKQQRIIKYVHTGFNQLTQSIVKTTQVLQSFNFKLLEGIDKESIFYRRTVHLASAMWKLNSGVGTRGQNTEYQGRQTLGGYSNYISQISQVQAAIEKLNNAPTQAFKEQLIALADALKKTGTEMNRFSAETDKTIAAMSRMGKANEISAEITKLSNVLSHFSGISNKNKTALSKFSQQITILQDKFRVLDAAFREDKISAETYEQELNKLANKLKSLGGSAQKAIRELSLGNAEISKTGQNIRNTGKGITTFNNGIVQTAHSGRILSNTLYQIRGALLSLKMIFTAMGGMALWGFASDIAEGVKESFTAKNEMEAQLNQRFTNKKGFTDTASIQYFRKELDKLPKTFKKVNKYAIGETVSSIGLEFDMTAKQMKDALPIVTMIQSEYVRAGRKEEEAALAVKDILQGEFQRLSRETGVGKEELVEYGWDEDKTNIDGLLKALKKAALDRHWDIFAKKATSLNDVMTITKSRFSEFGADVLNDITPLIVGGFNTIIDTISGLQDAFNGLNPFLKNFSVFGGGTALFAGILTALPMVTKGLGLVDIATMGWSKSILTAVFNLNKFEVGQYGLRKALAATLTGTKANEIATMRSSKAILGRVLGLEAVTLKEKGWLGAMVKNKASMKEGITLLSNSSAYTMTRAQKLAYLTTNIDLNTASSLKQGEAIRKVATSWKIWRTAILGVVGIGLIAWFSSVATWTDTVKKRMETYNDVLASGKDQIKDAQDTLNTYEKKLAGMSKNDPNYALTKSNRDTAKHNIADLEASVKLAKEIKKTTKETEEANSLMIKGGLNEIYSANGVKNIEKYGAKYQQIKYAAYDIKKAEEESHNFQYASLQHIAEHVKYMEQAGIGEKERVKYITEYSTKAEEAAQHLKEFNEGNFESGLYYVLDRIALLWIDLWNNDKFLSWWDSVKKTWDEMKPTVYAIKDILLELGGIFLDFTSTDIGRYALMFAGLGTVLGIVGKKAYDFLGGTKSTLDILKSLGKPLKDRISDWRKYKDKVEDAKDAEKGTKSTGGINGDVESGKGKTPFKETLKNDAKNYARAAVGIAAGMLLITEAIVMLKAPMWGLAEVGKQFKADEPNIRAGIDGLKLIAPVMAVLLPPVVALTLIMDKFAPSFTQMLKGGLKAALGIAMGMLLVAETITLIIPSIWALGALGDQYSGIETQVKKGTVAMKTVSDALNYLAPFIPALALGIATIALAFANPVVGAIMGTAITLGIPIGMLWVAETIWSLEYPLNQIASLGDKFSNLDKVKQGAEAIKVTAEALGYVEQAMRAFALIAWESLATSVANLIGIQIGVDLTQLTGEGGFFSQLETFTSEFNKIEITQIDTDKVETLKTSATGIDSVKTALVTVKDALKDLPNFEVDNRSTNQKYQDAVSGQETTSGITNYFEQLKQPIEQLNTFINNFNQLEIQAVDPDKVATIQSSANFISTIKTAIDNVKAAVGSAVDTQWNANVQTSGLLGAGIGLLVGNAGQSSGIKAGLDELYNCVKDIMDFNTRISGLTSEGSGDTSGITGASNMVSALQTQINSLKTTLSGAIPTIKSTAKGMGSAIITGFQSGMTTWTSTVKTSLSSANDSFKTSGETYGTKLKDGFKSKAKLKSTVQDEITYTFEYLDGKKEDFYNKGAALGDSLSQGFKDHKGLDQNSPGRMARAVSDELGFIGQAFSTGAGLNLPQMAANLAQTLSTNFNPSFTMGSLQLPNLDQFKQGLGQIPAMVTNVKTQVGTNFAGIQTSIGNSFNNIVSKTRLSLGTMLSATTKNIGSIRTSWKGMQSALIASAENIKTQTGQKISKLKTNLGDFWNKIKHPDQLIGGSAGGKPTGTIRRRSRPHIKTSGYAGTPMFKPKTSRKAPDYDVSEYFKCLFATGSPCYAGWNFNWTKKISDKFNGWNTHFNKFNLDSHLNVGKFKNNNFPVKGNAEIFKDYVYDVIKGTTYDFYFNSNYGDDPVAALRAGHFNCWDGTNIIIALANAFGLNASQGHGTWNGIGHMFARVAGIGVIDPTAIQRGFGFTSPKVKGYSAGSPSRSGNSNVQMGNTYGDIHITINNNGEDMTVNEKNVDKQTSKKIYDILRPSLSTGK